MAITEIEQEKDILENLEYISSFVRSNRRKMYDEDFPAIIKFLQTCSKNGKFIWVLGPYGTELELIPDLDYFIEEDGSVDWELFSRFSVFTYLKEDTLFITNLTKIYWVNLSFKEIVYMSLQTALTERARAYWNLYSELKKTQNQLNQGEEKNNGN